jgi:hypothetical protein
MIQPSTLHDFVLNLLSDPSLKDAFAADAQGTLEQAGLADITAVDVQEVIPLVLDLLPATPAGLPAIDGVDLTLPAGDVLADGPLGAISQLQAVASQLTSSGVNLTDLQTSSAGMLAVGEDGLQLAAANQSLGEYARAGLGIDGDFSAVTDVTSVLDQTASPVTGTVLDVADTATATVDAPLDGVTSTAGRDGPRPRRARRARRRRPQPGRAEHQRPGRPGQRRRRRALRGHDRPGHEHRDRPRRHGDRCREHRDRRCR